MLVVDIVDNAGHPNTIELIPILVLFQVIEKEFMNTVEVGVAATHLCLLYTHGQFLFYIICISIGMAATETCRDNK